MLTVNERYVVPSTGNMLTQSRAVTGREREMTKAKGEPRASPGCPLPRTQAWIDTDDTDNLAVKLGERM